MTSLEDIRLEPVMLNPYDLEKKDCIVDTVKLGLKAVGNIVEVFKHEFYYEHNNIISLIGERGSGKTSILLSIANCGSQHAEIKKYYPEATNLEKVYFFNKKNKWLIDPGKFGSITNIIQIFISNLFTSVSEFPKNTKYETKLNEVFTLFKKVIEGLTYSKESMLDQFDAQDMLLHCNNYMVLEDNINLLIKKYLEYVNLVNLTDYICMAIFVDDIDLSVNNCFAMLEQLRLFLKKCNVIIFISFKKEMLEYVIKSNYVHEFKTLLSYNENQTIKLVPDITDLTNRYITKLVPIDNQISTPNIKLIIKQNIKDFRELINVKDNFCLEVLEKLFKLILGDNLRTINQNKKSLSKKANIEDFVQGLCKILNYEEEIEFLDIRKFEDDKSMDINDLLFPPRNKIQYEGINGKKNIIQLIFALKQKLTCHIIFEETSDFLVFKNLKIKNYDKPDEPIKLSRLTLSDIIMPSTTVEEYINIIVSIYKYKKNKTKNFNNYLDLFIDSCNDVYKSYIKNNIDKFDYDMNVEPLDDLSEFSKDIRAACKGDRMGKNTFKNLLIYLKDHTMSVRDKMRLRTYLNKYDEEFQTFYAKNKYDKTQLRTFVKEVCRDLCNKFNIVW